MRVLSLFDGMACWYEALQRAWIPIDKYYASEIDKYAIQIAEKNHPSIEEIWDVKDIFYENWLLKKYMSESRKTNIWVIDAWPIDLLIWGSPCQWFSVAGKWLNFEDPRSKLFFEYVRLLREVKPKYFLLENVKMKKEWQDIISWYLWVQPIEINSSKVSAQNRKRLYRTNIPWVIQPQDKWILLKDILQDHVDDKYYYSAERWNAIISNPHNHDFLKRTENVEWKCNTLTSVTWGNQEKKIDLVQLRGGELLVRQATKQGYAIAHDGDWISLAYPNSTTRRGRVQYWKSDTLTTQWESHVFKDKQIRKLTPIECERLQTLPDNYTEWVSDTQRYKMLWNWWTVDVIAHIFRFIPL